MFLLHNFTDEAFVSQLRSQLVLNSQFGSNIRQIGYDGLKVTIFTLLMVSHYVCIQKYGVGTYRTSNAKIYATSLVIGALPSQIYWTIHKG